MAAVTATQTATTLTPPSSSNGLLDPSIWNFSVPVQNQNSTLHTKPVETHDYSSHDYSPASQQSDKMLAQSRSRSELSSTMRRDSLDGSRTARSQHVDEGVYLAPARISALNRQDSSISESGSAPDSLLDLYGQRQSENHDLDPATEKNGAAYGSSEDPTKWIHRDKLARIENQELQAAGIILPRARTTSRSGKREQSRDQLSKGVSRSEQQQMYGRLNEASKTASEEAEEMSRDLRLPEEIATHKADMYGSWSSHKGMSRLPVSKSSPIPIPLEYIERDTPAPRRKSISLTAAEEDLLVYPSSQGRSNSVKVMDDARTSPTSARTSPTTARISPTSARRIVSDASPTKKAFTPAARKSSAPGNRVASGSAKTKPKAGSATKDTRPSTKSGELNHSGSVNKRPEGDPPWLATMYKPDPRLPPDQQLLPTVAKRLQQEQWEKEGRFGNAYDTSFRPVNDEQFSERPEIITQVIDVPVEKQQDASEWPLKGTKSPPLSPGRPGTAGGYSTMPRIQDKMTSPLPSPRPMMPPPKSQVIRIPEPPEQEIKKKGCMGCAVM